MRVGNAATAGESANAAEEMSLQSEELRSMIAGFRLITSNDYTVAMRAGGRWEHLMHFHRRKKDGKAMYGLQPNPSKMIPLDDKDRSILNTFCDIECPFISFLKER